MGTWWDLPWRITAYFQSIGASSGRQQVAWKQPGVSCRVIRRPELFWCCATPLRRQAMWPKGGASEGLSWSLSPPTPQTQLCDILNKIEYDILTLSDR